MKQNLDNLRAEAERYLAENGFVIFRGYSRRLEEAPVITWDAGHHPDFRDFLHVAHEFGVRLVVLHHRELEAGFIDDAIDELETRLDYDEDGSIRRRLTELRVYEGFTCAVELSFQLEGTIYLYELTAPWYDEFRDIQDELDMVLPDEEVEDEDDSSGGISGYYSRN